VRSVQVVGLHAYVMNRVAGLDVFDVSNPLQPRRIGGTPLIGGLLASATDLMIAGGKVYALAGERGLVILDQFRDPNVLRLEILPSLTPGSFRFLLQGAPGVAGRIQRSSNLQDWVDWMPFSLGAVPLDVADPFAGTDTTRYYRARSP
jgi:hypothetical protein